MEANFDGAFVRQWATNAVDLLAKHRNELNALNVFPIPDGDTGTNLYLTFKAAATAESERSGEPNDIVDAFKSLAHGALLGARGNSGVILAQTLQGFAKYVQQENQISLSNFFAAGAKAARNAVAVPQEGTALTVLDAVASANVNDPKTASAVARESLEKTREMLPALKQAGVVDAGGRGVVLFIDALVSAWYQIEVDSKPVGFVPENLPQSFNCGADGKFELMFVVPTIVADEVVEVVAGAGTSLVVTSGETLTQIHIHLDSPEKALSTIRTITNPRNIRIELLEDVRHKRALVVQAFGSGVVQMFAEQGAFVVPSEPDERSSVSDFVDAAIRSGAEEVVLVSADSDTVQVLDLAGQVLVESGIKVSLVQAKTIPEAIAAVSMFDLHSEFKTVVIQMQSAAEQVKSISISRANRATKTPIGEIAVGDYLLLANSDLVAHGPSILSLADWLSEYSKNFSFATVIWGIDFADEDKKTFLSIFNSIEKIEFDGYQDVWKVLVGLE